MDRKSSKHVTATPLPSDASVATPTRTTTTSPMKRKAGQEQGESGPRRAPRQDPVSCESCRRKKLKCNRQQPCSSCVTRRLVCSYGVSGGEGTGVQRVPVQMGTTATTATNAGIGGPADEGLMGPSSRGHEASRWPVMGVVARPADGQTSRDRNESLETADWLEKIVMGDRVTTGLSSMGGGALTGPKIQDVVSPRQGSTVTAGMSGMSGQWTASQDNPATVQLGSFLPKKTEAMALFHYYTGCIDYLYHIILPRRVEEQIHGVYHGVEKGEPVDLNHLALLFSIVASALFLQLSIESSEFAGACSREYTFLTGAALIQGNYSVYPTIEGLQATLIVAHNMTSMNIHPSVNSLFSMGSIVSQAKALMLHCIDSPRFREARKANGCDLMDVELRRRLWWDLVTYDW